MSHLEITSLRYVVDARYGATCFARRSENGLRNFVAPLSVCLDTKAQGSISAQYFHKNTDRIP